jgi:hypothetical protein
MIPGETIQSPLPWDLPWWMADHAIFFGVLYIVLLVIGGGMGLVVLKSLQAASSKSE